MRRTYLFPAVLVWTIVSAGVFVSVDAIATRPVEIYLEDLREPGKTDDQVLMEAVQLAHAKGGNWWWIHDGVPVIVLDGVREYRIDPALYDFFDVPVVKRDGTSLANQRVPAMKREGASLAGQRRSL